MIRIKNKQYNILGGFLGWMWFALIVIPIYYIVVTSLRDQSEIYSENPLSLPKHFTFDAYGRVFANDFLRYIGNTLFVTVVTVALILLVTVMAAYAITRRADAGARAIYKVIITGLAIPMQATIIPVYYLIIQMGLYDTLWAIILPSVGSPFPSPL